MARIFLTHIPHMLQNYYGERAVAALRKLGEVVINPGDQVLDAKALFEASKGCDIIVSDRQTPGPREFFEMGPDAVAFLRCAVDIRNIDVAAASKQGILVTHATPGFIASVSEQTIGLMIDIGRNVSEYVMDYRSGKTPTARPGRQLKGATLGIMGYGDIGQYLAPLGVALGMTVLISDPFKKIEDPSTQAGRSHDAAARKRFRGLPRGRQRENRKPDERSNLRADEAVRLFHQHVARQSRRRRRAHSRARQQDHRGCCDGCRPRAGPDAVTQTRAPRRRGRNAAQRGPHAARRSSIRRSIR